MAREWKPGAFRATLERKVGSDHGKWAEAVGIDQWELDKLLRSPLQHPHGEGPHTLAPHPSEIRFLESQLDVDALSEEWITQSPHLTDGRVGREEFLGVLEPTGDLAKRWARGDLDAYREVLTCLCNIAQTEYVCAPGQTFRFCATGIEFFLMDSYGEHHYRDRARELGLTLKRCKGTKTRHFPRRRFWLAEGHRQ